MAKFEVANIDEYIQQLHTLGTPAVTSAIIKMAVFDGAAVVADEVRANIPKDSGDLASSMYLAPMVNESGYIFTKLGFAGYDGKGVPNQLKAAVLEHGRSGGVGKRPFIRKSINAVKDSAVAAMEQRLEKEIEKLVEE